MKCTESCGARLIADSSSSLFLSPVKQIPGAINETAGSANYWTAGTIMIQIQVGTVEESTTDWARLGSCLPHAVTRIRLVTHCKPVVTGSPIGVVIGGQASSTTKPSSHGKG